VNKLNKGPAGRLNWVGLRTWLSWRLARRRLVRSLDGPLRRSVALISGGTVLGQGVVILTYPLLTRLYTPSDFGVLAVFTAILAVMSNAAALRLEPAIPIAHDDDEAAHVLVLAALAVITTTSFSALAVWLLGGPVSKWTHIPELGSLLWLLPLGLAAAGMTVVLANWLIRYKGFSSIARSNIAQSWVQVGGQAILGLLRTGSGGLLAGSVLGYAAGGAMLARPAMSRLPDLRRISAQGLLAAGRRYRRFPMLSAGSGMLNSAGLQLAPILFATLYGSQVAGWFGLGARVAAVPVVFVGQAIAQVYFGEVSRLVRERPAELSRIYFATAKRVALVGLLPVLVVELAAPRLFGYVFGPSWVEAAIYAQLLAVPYLASFVMFPISLTLDALERQDLVLAWDVGRLVLIVATIEVSAHLGASSRTAVGLYGAAMLVAYIAYFAIVTTALPPREPVSE
jgi:O-antigen/teichoic acid export membrane protein